MVTFKIASTFEATQKNYLAMEKKKPKPKMPNNVNIIDPYMLIEVVYNEIDFDLDLETWFKIDEGFDICWNEEIGINNWVIERQIQKSVNNYLIKKEIIFDFEKLAIIIGIMLNYIKKTGGCG